MSRPSFNQAIAPLKRRFFEIMQDNQAALDGTSLGDRDPAVIRDLLPLWGWLSEHYFAATVEGLEHIPDEPILMVGSHNGGLAAPDMFVLFWAWFNRFGADRPAYGLMNAKMWTGYPQLARLAAKGGAIRANPKMAIAALKANASVLVYPGGARDVFRHHSLRHRIFLNGNLAFIKLALRQQVPVVPVISLGAHDTLKVVGDVYPYLKQLHQWGMPWLLGIDPEVWPIYLGWPWGIGVGPVMNIPYPHPIHLKICPPIYFERTGPQAAKDQAYVIRCYDQVYAQMQTTLDQLVQAFPPKDDGDCHSSIHG